jgi:hypothetical protein
VKNNFDISQELTMQLSIKRNPKEEEEDYYQIIISVIGFYLFICCLLGSAEP